VTLSTLILAAPVYAVPIYAVPIYVAPIYVALIHAALVHRSSDPRGFVLWCLVGFGVGIGLFIYGFRLLQRRRLILDTPFSKIRSAAMGMVEVSGLAVGPYTMIAPVTGHPCYYYSTAVWEYKQNGKNKNWVKVAGECMHLPFFVDDNTGRVLVDPRGADLDLHRDFQEEFCDSFFTTKEPMPGNVRTFLSRHGIVTYNKIKVEEYCIKPKNSLFILGTLGENPGIEVGPEPIQYSDTISSISAGGFSLSLNSLSFSAGSGGNFSLSSIAQRFSNQPEAAPDSVRHEGIHLSPQSGATKTADASQQQKITAALLKAGIASPAAWAAAGVSASYMATPTATSGGVHVLADAQMAAPGSRGSDDHANSSTPANGFDHHPPAALMKGTHNKPFLISWRSQQQVARSLGWKCTLMIWGGAALAVLSLYFGLGIKNLF
jgi:hypothetical protein